MPKRYARFSAAFGTQTRSRPLEGLWNWTEFRLLGTHTGAHLLILGALNWTPEWYSQSGPESAEVIGRKMADCLIHGLRAVPQAAGASPAVVAAPGAKRATRGKGVAAAVSK